MENIRQGGGAPSDYAIVVGMNEPMGGGAPAAEDVVMDPPSGGGAPASRGGVVSKFNLLSSELLRVIVGFAPFKLTGVSARLTAFDANLKLDMLKKVKTLNEFSYLEGELPERIDTENRNFDLIRLINRLFKRVCGDIQSLVSIISEEEITIQKLANGILRVKDPGRIIRIIRKGKDLALQEFSRVISAFFANSTPQAIRTWFADPANEESLMSVSWLDLSNRNLRYLPDEISRFKNIHNLDLSNNPLIRLPDSIATLPRLRTFDLSENPNIYVPDSIRNWFLARVHTYGENAFMKLPDQLRADREFVVVAVANGWKQLPDQLRADREFVLAVVRQKGMALRYASDELKADREVVFAAVGQNSMALEFAAPQFQADRDFVLAAVRQNGMALEFAAPQFQADRDFVLAAVRQNGMALEFAAPQFQEDKKVVEAAVRQNGGALLLAPKFSYDQEIRDFASARLI